MTNPVLYSRDNPRSRVELQEYFTIGSDENCHLHLIDSEVGSRQCRIEFRSGSWILRDLRSGKHTKLNGTKILEAELSNQDEIQIGGQSLIFESQPTAKETPFPIMSKNEEWQAELMTLANVAKSPHPILLLGQSGTGKDVLANALHQESDRQAGPFVSVNCSALTETLVESELFGHTKGSFTGAINDRKGAFESARSGTLFLDEIGDLPLCMQAKLLRALENNEIRPVGADRTIKTDVRIIAATHQNLSDRIKEGLFREDLFYRLNVINVSVPSLSQRMEDFDVLFGHFSRLTKCRFSMQAILRLKKHPWPGNIRELRNVIYRASALFPGQEISEVQTEKLLATSGILQSTHGGPVAQTMPVIKEIEKQMIVKRLIANKGNQKRTAYDLGMPKSTLHDRLKTYEINADEYK